MTANPENNRQIWRGSRQEIRIVVTVLTIVLLSVLVACGKKRVSTALPEAGSNPSDDRQVGSTQRGIASWYGHPYHGRRTASGEVYDMMQPTAAHQTLPFQTRVRVTNLDNGRSTRVRINDRGPFVDGRIIDLSRKAAEEIQMVGPGTARVKLEILGGGTDWKGLFTVQVGAFRERKNAERLRQELDAEFDSVTVEDAPGGIHRVRVGKVAERKAANQLAVRLRRHPKIQGALVVEIPE